MAGLVLAGAVLPSWMILFGPVLLLLLTFGLSPWMLVLAPAHVAAFYVGLNTDSARTRLLCLLAFLGLGAAALLAASFSLTF